LPAARPGAGKVVVDVSSALPRGLWRPGAETGATLFEYVLLLAVVALASAGALIYFGHSAASPARQLKSVERAVSLGGSQSGALWCASDGTGPCTMTVAVGTQKTINFWASGGVAPYSYSLKKNPGFLTLYSQANEIVVHPTSCPPGGPTYSGLTLLVTDGAQETGELTFSVTVEPC